MTPTKLTKVLRHFTIEVSVLTLQQIPSRITGEMLEDTLTENLNATVVKTVIMNREDCITPEDERQIKLPL